MTLSKGEIENPFQHDHDTLHPLSMKSPSVKQEKVIDQVFTTIYNIIVDEKLIKYWIEQGRFPANMVDEIDLENQEKTMKLATLSTRRFVSKWSSEWIATKKYDKMVD